MSVNAYENFAEENGNYDWKHQEQYCLICVLLKDNHLRSTYYVSS